MKRINLLLALVLATSASYAHAVSFGDTITAGANSDQTVLTNNPTNNSDINGNHLTAGSGYGGSVGNTTANGGQATGGAATGGAAIGNQLQNQNQNNGNSNAGFSDSGNFNGTVAGGTGGAGGNVGNVAGGTVGNTTSTGGAVSDSGNSASVSGAQAGASTGASTATTGASSANTGASIATTGASRSGSDNSISTTNNTNVRTQFIPSVTVGTPASIVPGANVVVQVGACGPLVTVTSEKVNGTFFGLFSSSDVDQGTTDTVVPVLNEDGTQKFYNEVKLPDGSIALYGSQVTTFSAVVGVSGARQFALGGGGGNSGNWGQGSLGTSSANQRIVLKHSVVSCAVGTLVPVKDEEAKVSALVTE